MYPEAKTWSDCIPGRQRQPSPSNGHYLVGVLDGEGVGSEVVGAGLTVLQALETISPYSFIIRRGGLIGTAAEQAHGAALTAEVENFCRHVFADGGALLHGAGGGRFVYDLRRRFDLFCKIVPVRTDPALRLTARLKPEYCDNVDLIIIRDNAGGIYQGQWSETTRADGTRVANHNFSYAETDVRRILEAAAGIARRRRGRLTVIYKDAGIPTISELWRDCALEITAAAGIELQLLNVDYAAYCVIQHARDFDVIVAPNLFGDVLADLSAVLLGSRALAYSGNFAPGAAAAYQTNHGAAYDLAGKNVANPAGQILSVAMLLRESFGLSDAADAIERAVHQVWRQGWRTADLMELGGRLVGTREMGELVADIVFALYRESNPA
ncbi:MAG: isocitrate/isopropylmalate family dehydrogenase [Candidatus Competibacteraceae bacterium]